MCGRAGIYGKNLHQVKMTKNGQKWLFKKIMSLVLSGICVKWQFLWFTNILWKLHAWEKSGSQVSQKSLLTSEISVFFNRQYFTNRLISDFDFWHVDRHEWKKQGSLTGFQKKFSFGEMGYFWPTLRILITLDTQEEFFKILHSESG